MCSVNYIDMGIRGQGQREEGKVLLTLSNIQYLVEGLNSLLQTNLDGEKRSRVIQLRDELVAQIDSIFADYS
jgi:hypothetical protein